MITIVRKMETKCRPELLCDTAISCQAVKRCKKGIYGPPLRCEPVDHRWKRGGWVFRWSQREKESGHQVGELGCLRGDCTSGVCLISQGSSKDLSIPLYLRRKKLELCCKGSTWQYGNVDFPVFWLSREPYTGHSPLLSLTGLSEVDKGEKMG